MYLVNCFKKLFTSPTFWCSILATAVICMFSGVYNDRETGTKTIIEMFAQYSKAAMLGDVSLNSYAVFKAGFGNWISMFVPVVTTLASVTIFVDEQKSRVSLFTLPRAGIVKCTIGACAFFLLAGGLTLMLGFALFALLCAVMFPPLSAYPAEMSAQFIEYTFWQGTAMSKIFGVGGTGLCIIAGLIETFVYGMVCSAGAMVLCVFSQNKYVTICTPFFLKYALGQFSMMLGVKATQDPFAVNEKLLAFANTIHPDGINSILNYSQNVTAIIIINGAFLLITAALFCILRIRRLKNGT